MCAQCHGAERDQEGKGYKSSLILFIRGKNCSDDDDEKCKKSGGKKKKGEELQKLRTETTVRH